MERNMKLNFLGVLALGMLIAPMTSQASLIKNGGFESGLTNWSCDVLFGDCFTENSGGPKEGDFRWFGFENANAREGTLSQSFDTAIGTTYSLEFWYGSSNPINNLSVTVADLDHELNFTDWGIDSWTFISTTFIADSAISTLAFSFSTQVGSGGLWLDDVRVNSVATVPAPSTLGLLGLGLVGVGLMKRRKTNLLFRLQNSAVD